MQEWQLTESGNRINLTLLNVDIQKCTRCKDGNCYQCSCDYVEILGRLYCGSWNWTGSVVSCVNEARFSSDESFTLSGFRAEWTEISGDVD